MKDFITPSLTFTPGASGIGNVDLYGIAGFDVKRLVSIINQTTGTIIYSTADTALRYTQVIGTTVYLNFDTATMSGANTIQVVYDTPYPLPVSVSSLPLPVGAATSNNQLSEIAVLDAINAKNPTLVSGRVPVDGSGVTQPVSAASLPLPTGAATESKQSDGNASLTSIDSKTPSLVGGKVPVDISGTVAVSGPLTDAQLRASAVPVSISTAVPVTGPLTDAQLRANPVPVSGTVTANTGLSQPLTDTQLRATPVPISGTVAANTGLTQPLTDSQLRAANVNVDVQSTVLASGAATAALQGTGNSTLSSIDGRLASPLPLMTGVATAAGQSDIRTTHPLYGDRGAVVRQSPADIWSVGFADSGSGLLATELTQRRLGTGMGVSQSNSNLLVTTGTTANSEFLARSVISFRGAFIQRHKTILSQRIANNNFAVLMADRVGEGLACTINSATSVTITKVAHGFTAVNVGQFIFIGAINGANGVPGRYAIASVPTADTINFTVAGWPASGSCTVDLFGWNYFWTNYTGTTATQANVDAQRKGWNSGNTLATINTTASPGHVMQTYADGRNVNWADTLVASATVPNVATRASRIENLPDDDVEVFVYLWVWNGTTNPASTTTWTLGFLSVEDVANVPTYLAGVRPQGNNAPLPVVFPASQPVTPAALVASSAVIGDVGVNYRATVTGAATSLAVQSPATPAATTIKASAGRLIGYYLQNSSSGIRSVKVFNVVAGSVVLGTTSAAFAIDIPANGTAQLHFEGGIAFSTAMTYSVSSAKGLTDNTSTGLATNDVSGFFAFA